MTTVTDRTHFPNGVELGKGVADQLAGVMVATLDNPVLADPNRLLISVVMANGAYTLDETTHADGLARNVTVTHTTDTGTDTLGTVTIVGLDLEGKEITEVITPTADATVAGTKAFLSVTSATQAGWVISGGNDTIEIGTGDLIGLPVKLDDAANIVMSVLGTAIVAATAVAGGDADADGIEDSTVDASAGTYDGAKDLRVFIRI